MVEYEEHIGMFSSTSEFEAELFACRPTDSPYYGAIR